jgi:cobalt-zinc-cadmium resistance protein CzcA
MPPNVADNYIMLKPKSEWPDPNLSKNELTAQIQKQ